jgi:hypothetical protein
MFAIIKFFGNWHSGITLLAATGVCSPLTRTPSIAISFCGSFRIAAGAGQRDCRQKLAELRPYAPQQVPLTADLGQLAKVQLSIQLCMELQHVIECV